MGRRFGSKLVAIAATAIAVTGLAACDPPPPDGRDLGVTLEALPTAVDVGSSTSAEIVVRNHGTVTADASSLIVSVPNTLSPTLTGAVDGCSTGSHDELAAITCDLGDLAPGATATATLTLTGVTAGSVRPVTVSVASPGTEPTPDPNPNQATDSIAVHQVDEVDLHVTPSRNPGQSGPGVAFDSITTVANRGPSVAADVTVSQTFRDDTTVTAATLQRADGGATGTCTIAPGSVTCSTGANGIDPLQTAADRWLLTVTMVPPSAAFFVDHAATSAQPEPTPDGWPNEVRTTIYRNDDPAPIDLGVVDVGTEFEATFDLPGFFPIYQYASFDLPEGIELVGLRNGTSAYPCGATGCNSLPWYFEGPLTARFRAVAPTDPTSIFLNLSSEGGHAYLQFDVVVADPTITSDIHPDVAEVSYAVVGERQELDGMIRNTGDADHSDVVLDVDGRDVTAVRIGDDQLPCAATATGFRCSIDTLAGHSVVPVRVVVVPELVGDAELSIAVTSATAQDSPDPHADQQVIAYGVDPRRVDLGVAVTATPEQPTLDAPFRVAATVTNDGTIAAPDTQAVITMPAGFSIGSVTASYPRPSGFGGCATSGTTVTCDIGDLEPRSSIEIALQTTATDATGGDLTVTATSARAEATPDPAPNQYART